MKRGRFRLWMKRGGLLIAGFALALLGLERMVRVMMPQSQYAVTHAPWGFRHLPNTTITFYHENPDSTIPLHPVTIRYNASGFRDYDYPYGKPPGTFRILFLGDSWAEDMGSYLENLHVKYLERELNSLGLPRRFEVINGGHYAYDNAQELMLCLHEGIKYDPDLVMLLYTGDSASPQYATVEDGRLALHEQRFTFSQKLYRGLVTWVRSRSQLGNLVLNNAYRFRGLQEWLVSRRLKEQPVAYVPPEQLLQEANPPQVLLASAIAPSPQPAQAAQAAASALGAPVAPVAVGPAAPAVPEGDELMQEVAARAKKDRDRPAHRNCLLNSSFERWPARGHRPPYDWFRDGEPSFTVARDTKRVHVRDGHLSCQLISQSGSSRITQAVLPVIGPLGQKILRGKRVSAACWVKTFNPDAVFLRIYDGRTTTDSAMHRGSGRWELLTVSHKLANEPTTLDLRIIIQGKAEAYVDEASLWVDGLPYLANVLHEQEYQTYPEETADALEEAEEKPLPAATTSPAPVPSVVQVPSVTPAPRLQKGFSARAAYKREMARLRAAVARALAEATGPSSPAPTVARPVQTSAQLQKPRTWEKMRAGLFKPVDQLIWLKFQETAARQGGRFVFVSIPQLSWADRAFLDEHGIPVLELFAEREPVDANQLRREDLRDGRYDPSKDSNRFGYKMNELVGLMFLEFLLKERLIPVQPSRRLVEAEGASARKIAHQ